MAFNILRAARAVVNVTDLDAARDFYVSALGFVETESDGEHIYLRGLEEHNHHCYVLKKADKPGVHALGYKVYSEADLEALSYLFESKGLETKWLEKGTQHAMGRTLRTYDSLGMPLEFFAEMDTVERSLQRYDVYKGSRMQRIDHFNCLVPDVEAAHNFYINKLGFVSSEYTEADGHIWASWIHRKPTVHDQAFMNGEGPKLHHVGFTLNDSSSILHVCDVLGSLGYGDAIERGPGRHGLSNAFFLYLRDPDGNRVELYTGDYLTTDPDFKPIRWDLDDPQRGTFWGHNVPDSWFYEATPFLDIYDNEQVKTQAAVLGDRKAQFTKKYV
ncbi:catechol 2,3-dioxygenase [Scopulibacillus darangshiensis]|uniref:Catechol 2,3-dioxygenase n=1 Tax=Scopulibacillus darangshiensis TaxID=442528 RepID=A0A4V2SN78_9BACL|nr:3,4-dihydroxyphenylacetate 2,3-dioxygenase [Scopulibacillus darangshiensis]TCP30186.1 catechol 2,3-dioxygenase [Scopulibacillus darangshiensis]